MLRHLAQLTASRPRLFLFSLILLLTSIYLFNTFSSTSTPSFPKFEEQHVYPAEPHAHALNASSKRVAIIGAGASGSSAAWFLTRASGVVAQRLGVDRKEILDEVVVFERNDYVGGRTSVVYPHGDERLRPVEIGASIFVEANRHLVKGAKRFGLNTINPDFGDSGIAIWDGHQILYQTSTSKSWWSNWLDGASAIRRYGPLSLYRTDRAIKGLVSKFANLYNPVWLSEQGAADSIDTFAERVGLGREYVTRRADEWALDAVKVGVKWMSEVWEGSTRVNYALDMGSIHALGAAVSLATGGAKMVEGGNWQIFDRMVKESDATLRLGTEVVDIVPLNKDGQSPRFEVHTNDSIDNGHFDQIFYARPWFSSRRDHGFPTLQRHLVEPVPRVKYIHLHVTLFTTTRSSPLPSFFDLPDGTALPTTILTSTYTSRSQPEAGIPPPRFNSISWHSETYPGSGEYVVKIFSVARLTDRFIRELIGEDPTWLVRKEWMSYPRLEPITTYPPVEPVKGLQYLGALEPWVSTMETQTLSAREGVARVVQDWWGLGYGECKGGADAWDWSCEQ